MSSEDLATESARTRSTVTDGLDRLMHASADRVFAAPEPRAGGVVIPAARVDLAGGFGVGLDGVDSKPNGRPVAFIEAGPEGVRVRPVVGLGRVGLALAAAGVVVWAASRGRRR